MRISLRKAIQWTCVIVLVQLAVYYWTIQKPKKSVSRVPIDHHFLKSLEDDTNKCTPRNCPAVKEGVMNVHLIAHSHIDVGWTKSVEQYYVGEPVAGVWASGCVKCTFDGTIAELLKNSSRRFIFVEMKYLARYWEEINDSQRKDILQLIKELMILIRQQATEVYQFALTGFLGLGITLIDNQCRLEITNGGWVMSDAGVTMYNDIIDQHTMGFDFIRNKFGPCAQSRTGWHVDQFGHSREHASIFAQMGYDSLFIGRIDYRDLAERKAKREMEMSWRTSPRNYRDQSSLFTHIFFDGYYSPPGFNFESDHISWDEPEEARRSALLFIERLKERAQTVQTNHMLVPMGCDFGYRSEYAEIWFKSMDKLIEGVHQNQKAGPNMTFNLLYSTPSCYAYHVNKEKFPLPVKVDDFHPYGIAPGAYWTGYFTTRGGLKMHIKRAGQVLQSCKHLSIFSSLTELSNKVTDMRDMVAIMQHHDAITGTQRLAVLHDYNLLISQGIAKCETVMSAAYQRLWRGGNISEGQLFHFCPALNISSCDISENNRQFYIAFYNPLSWSVNVVARFPVKSQKVDVFDLRDSLVDVQVVPIPRGILDIPERDETESVTEAVFEIQIPPMTATAVKVKTGTGAAKPEFEPDLQKGNIIIENEHLLLMFDSATGLLTSMVSADSRIEENLEQDFAYYPVRSGWERTSGAYLFVPATETPTKVATGKVEIKVVKGDVVHEVHQRFSDWVSQVVRIYKGSQCAEFQWIVGPLDNNEGKEVVSRFKSGLKTGKTFFTDSNGREAMTRIRKTKGGNSSHVADAVSGNYFSVTSRIFIQDKQKKSQLTILPDRVQGGSSLESGSIELLVHRNTLEDDNLGLAQALQDQGIDGKGIIFTGKHYVCLDTIAKSSKLTRQLAQQLHLAPVPMFASVDPDRNIQVTPKQRTFVTNPLPDNINILTLDRIPEEKDNFFLLRLEHIFENDETTNLSGPVTIALEPLFQEFMIVSAEETTLGGNFIPNELSRMSWITVDGPTSGSIQSPNYKEKMEPPFEVELLPMEIRTFRISVVWMK